MPPQVDVPSLVEALIVLSGIGGVGTGVRWFFFGGRKRSRVDAAQVVQKMATDTLTLLMEPLQVRVESLQGDLTSAQRQMGHLRVELETVLDYAILAHAIFAQPAVAEAIVAAGNKVPTPPDLVLRRP